MNNSNKEYSPFTPGSPVPVELFVGRADQIAEIIRYINQATTGKQENAFVVGDRGIGKSSLASFLRYFVTTQKNMIGIHVFLGGVSNLEDMVRKIFDELLKEARTQRWYEKVKQLFGTYIKEIGVFNISVSFNPPKDDLGELVREFPRALNSFLERVKDEKEGLFIALDDIDGLAGRAEFSNWFKSFADKVATHYKDFPVFIMLVGLPEQRDVLSTLQPSLMRIFRVIDIERLSSEEVHTFISQAFEKANIKVESSAMEYMVDYSSGLPVLMHEIGDAVFWADKDGVVDEDDAITGILLAAGNVGQKYLTPQVYKAIRSQSYRAILRKFGKREIATSRYFEKRELEAKLSTGEKKVLNNFLRKMRELGVIERDIEGGLGAYKFVNDIYPVYIWLEGTRFERTKSS